MTWWERAKYDEVFQKSMNVTMILGCCGCVLHNETRLPPFFEKWKSKDDSGVGVLFCHLLKRLTTNNKWLKTSQWGLRGWVRPGRTHPLLIMSPQKDLNDTTLNISLLVANKMIHARMYPCPSANPFFPKRPQRCRSFDESPSSSFCGSVKLILKIGR